MYITTAKTGYVGLVAKAYLVDISNNIIYIDSNSKKINSLKNEIIPICKFDYFEIGD